MDLMDLDPVTEAALYKPLRQDEFRLALLDAGGRNAPITVHLVACSIDSPPEYDGLSYVWGNARDTVPINCDGRSTNITVNLQWALNRVRLPDHPRYVWADALCINQNDAQERSRQVSLMGRIYSGARLVLVCVGEDPDGGAANVASLMNDYGPILTRPNFMQHLSHLWASGHSTPFQDPRWRSLGLVMALPWFRRAWVLQEVGLAKNPRVMYGSTEFSYRYMMQTVRWIRAFAADFSAKMGISALLIHTQWADWSENWATTPAHTHYRFVDLLDHGALLKCQDPRDHIYAFMGHPLSRAAGLISPDYTKHKLQVYKEASVLLFRDAGVRALSSVEHSADTINDEYPSWVIRWDVGFILNNIYTHPSSKYRADLGLADGLARIENDIVKLNGVRLDTIRSVFRLRLLPECMGVLFQNASTSVGGTIFDLIRYLEDPSTPSAYANARAENLACTLCGLAAEPGGVINATSSIYGTWVEFLNFQRHSGTPEGLDSARTFWHTFAAGGTGRAFFVTDRGFYGLGSHISQPGDVCCVAHGSTVPFIMRPSPSKGPGYLRLVGEAYVHGIMQGELAEMLRGGQLREQSLLIH